MMFSFSDKYCCSRRDRRLYIEHTVNLNDIRYTLRTIMYYAHVLHRYYTRYSSISNVSWYILHSMKTGDGSSGKSGLLRR